LSLNLAVSPTGNFADFHDAAIAYQDIALTTGAVIDDFGVTEDE
jgi:hypothetical protein